MVKIYCSYTITNPQEIYNPNDQISGIFYIESKEKEGKKDKILKKVEIHLCEIYKEKETDFDMAVGWGTKTEWFEYKRKIRKYEFKSNINIKSGEIKSYKFEIKLPWWTPRVSEDIRDWHLALLFKQKTGMKLNLGKSPLNAYYVIPVLYSARPSSPISTAGRKEEIPNF
ncbi:MAG: hypothetical protein ACFFCE_14940 [Promethearchaeota archaeon]